MEAQLKEVQARVAELEEENRLLKERQEAAREEGASAVKANLPQFVKEWLADGSKARQMGKLVRFWAGIPDQSKEIANAVFFWATKPENTKIVEKLIQEWMATEEGAMAMAPWSDENFWMGVRQVRQRYPELNLRGLGPLVEDPTVIPGEDEEDLCGPALDDLDRRIKEALETLEKEATEAQPAEEELDPLVIGQPVAPEKEDSEDRAPIGVVLGRSPPQSPVSHGAEGPSAAEERAKQKGKGKVEERPRRKKTLASKKASRVPASDEEERQALRKARRLLVLKDALLHKQERSIRQLKGKLKSVTELLTESERSERVAIQQSGQKEDAADREIEFLRHRNWLLSRETVSLRSELSGSRRPVFSSVPTGSRDRAPPELVVGLESSRMGEAARDLRHELIGEATVLRAGGPSSARDRTLGEGGGEVGLTPEAGEAPLTGDVVPPSLGSHTPTRGRYGRGVGPTPSGAGGSSSHLPPRPPTASGVGLPRPPGVRRSSSSSVASTGRARATRVRKRGKVSVNIRPPMPPPGPGMI